MEHIYHITGMTCPGCRDAVQKALKAVEGVQSVEVNLENGTARIQMSGHIQFDVLQKALEGTHYHIHQQKPTEHFHKIEKPKNVAGTGIYYCPMHCEGDKTYSKPGNCPVCGMDLV